MPPTAQRRPDYELFGTQVEVMSSVLPEVVHSGPAGTGKSFGGLMKADIFARYFPGCRVLFVRKTRVSLVQSTLVTFERKVLAHRFSERPSNRLVYYHGGDHEYRYPNKSLAAIAGMDKSAKIMSTEWDFVLVDEGTELNEDNHESLTTRCRNYKAPFQQLLLMCNPDVPTHYIKKRERAGALKLVNAQHTDNPLLYDRATGRLTQKGRDYIAKLDALTGTRYKRLRKGIWCTTDGMCFDGFDEEHNVFNGWDPDTGKLVRDDATGRYGDKSDYLIAPPKTWRRTLSVDFGFSNPMVIQFWAEDEDGRLYLWLEIYHTGLLVEDAAARVIELCEQYDEPGYEDIFCDHDAEDRATLIKHLRKNWRFSRLSTTAAKKDVEPGLDAVRTRLKLQADGRARLLVRRNCTDRVDQELTAKHKPTSTLEEVWAYVYGPDGKPVKENDHGCDGVRYRVASVDLQPAENYTQTRLRR